MRPQLAVMSTVETYTSCVETGLAHISLGVESKLPIKMIIEEDIMSNSDLLSLNSKILLFNVSGSRAGLCHYGTPIPMSLFNLNNSIMVAESKFDDLLLQHVSKKELQRETQVITDGILRRKMESKLHFKRLERKKQQEKSKKKASRRDKREVFEPTADFMDKSMKRMYAESSFSSIEGSFASFMMNVFEPVKAFVEPVSDVLVPMCEFVYQLYRSRNIIDAAVAVHVFCRSLGSSLYDAAKYILDHFLHRLEFDNLLGSMTAESLSDIMGDYKVFLGQLLSSGLTTAFRDLVLSLVSLKFFGKDVSKKISGYIGKPPKMSVGELIIFAIDQLITLVKAGEALIAGLPFSTVLISKNPAKEYCDKVKAVLFYRDKLFTGLPVKGMMGLREFVTETDILVQTGEALISKMNSFSHQYAGVRDKLTDVKQAHYETSLRMNTASRHVPYGIILHGDPGVGKGRLLPFIGAIWASVKGRQFDESHIYGRVATSDYWEGHQPFSQYIVHYSELGNIHRDLAKSKGDPLVAELTTLMDSMPMCLDMAFGQKGTVYAHPELVLIDTNTAGLNLDVLVQNKAAHMRRFLYVEPIVKAEFRVDGGTNIDPAKSFKSDSNILDRWVFKVYYYTPTGVSTVITKVLMGGTDEDNIYKLVKVLKQEFSQHVANQERISNLSKEIKLEDYDESYKSFDFEGIIYGEDEPIPFTMEYEEDKEEEILNADDIEYAFEKFAPLNFKNNSRAEAYVDEVPEIRDIILEYLEETEEKFSVNTRSTGGVLPRVTPTNVEYIPPRNDKTYLEAMIAKLQRFAYLKTSVINNMVLFKHWLPLFMLSFMSLCKDVAFSTVLHLSPEPRFPVDSAITGLSLYYIAANILNSALYPLIVFLPWMLVQSITHGMGIRIMLNSARNSQSDRLARSWVRFKYMLGFGSYQDLTGFWQSKQKILVSLVAIVGFLAGCSLFKKTITDRVSKRSKKRKSKIPVTVVETIENADMYEGEAVFSKEIADFEQKMDCGKSVKRVAIKGHEVWNVQQLVVKPAIHSGDVQSLADVFERNVRQVIVVAEKEARTHVLGLFGNIALINTHALGNYEKVTIRVANTGIDIGLNRVFYDSIITDLDRVDLGNDLSLVCLKMTQFRDIRKHISSEFVSMRTCSAMIDSFKTRAQAMKEDVYQVNCETGPFSLSQIYVYNFPQHRAGDCGKPLFMESPGGSVCVGIHTGGMGSDGFATALKIGEINDGINYLKRTNPFIMVYSESDMIAENKFEDPVSKSPVRYEILQGMSYYGKIEGKVNVRQKSRLKQSEVGVKFREYLKETQDYEPSTVFGPPLMEPRKTPTEFISPYNVALRKMASQRGSLDSRILKKCINEYTERIVHMLKERGVNKLQPLDVTTAINGSVDDGYLKRINVSTSAGFGLTGKKSKYLVLEGDRPDETTRHPVEDIQNKIRDMMNAYAGEKSYGLVFTTHLKDEARAVEKIKLGKTRPFYATPLEGLIMSRMILAPLYTLMVQHGDIFGTAVGINMPSHGGDFLKTLTDFSENIMEGDYGNYDQKMPYDIGMAGYTVMYNVLKELGYNDLTLQMLQGLISDMLLPYVLMCLDMFMIPGHQPSGKYGTAEDNSIRGVLMLMYAWYSTPECSGYYFWDCVKPGTYGDDLLNAVKEEFGDYYNNHTYQKFCADVYRLDYTSASKDGKLEKFVSKDKCTFLKRTFKYREDIGHTVSPLHLDSIVKSLEWYIPSRNITTEEQFKGIVTSALWELAFHMTKRDHDKARVFLVQCVADEFCDGELFDAPTFDDIIGRVFS